MRTLKTLGLALVASLFLLAGCGGGDEPTQQPQAPVASVTTTTAAAGEQKAKEARASIKRAVSGIKTGPPKHALAANDPGRRMRPLSARANALVEPATFVATRDQIFHWAEATWPEIFPVGPSGSQLEYLGTPYTIRTYSTNNIIGITAAGEVQAIGPFNGNELRTYGTLTTLGCTAVPTACEMSGGTQGAGQYAINKETGHVWLPNLVNGELTWLGTTEGGRSVLPSLITSVNFRSNRRGWGDDNVTGAAPSPDGSYIASVNTCNKDRGLPTATTSDSAVSWLSFSKDGWGLVGDLNPHIVFGQIEYGGYEPATISSVEEQDKTVTIEVNFKSNCLFGYALGGKFLNLDRTLPFEFVFHCATCGANGGPGWGVGSGTTVPSVKKAYRVFDEANGNFKVRFTNMACTDQGSITVHPHLSIDGDNVVYKYEADGFGAWIALPAAGDGNPIWQPGDEVAFDPKEFQIKWNRPLCTVKKPPQ